MEKTNLFILTTPLQLINVIEAKKELGISNETSIAIFLPYASNFVAIKRILNPAEWKEIHFLEEDLEKLKQQEKNFRQRRVVKILQKAFSDRSKIEALIRQYSTVDNLFVGYYLGIESLHIMNRILYNRLYLLDDGIATIEINERRKSNRSLLNNWSFEFFLKVLVKQLVLRYDLRHPKSVTFFTVYDIAVGESDKLIRHSYKNVRKLVHDQEPTDEVVFLGQPLSEIHPMIVEERIYFEYLKKAIAHFKPRKVTYIPHRDELPGKVERLSGIPGFEAKWIDVPIELYLLQQRRRPAVIAGFLTSALPNCHVIFKDEVEIVSIRIERDHLLAMESSLNDMYKYFEELSDQQFKVISV